MTEKIDLVKQILDDRTCMCILMMMKNNDEYMTTNVSEGATYSYKIDDLKKIAKNCTLLDNVLMLLTKASYITIDSYDMGFRLTTDGILMVNNIYDVCVANVECIMNTCDTQDNNQTEQTKTEDDLS